MDIIRREIYEKKLIALKDKQIIKVITGVRRCGKSTLLKQYRAYLTAHGVDENRIIFINFEDYDFAELKNAAADPPRGLR